jgi:hypothetical protein
MDRGRGSSAGSAIYTYAVSVTLLAVGIVLLIAVHASEHKLLWLDVGRDFGITLCSIGILSLCYEAVIRKQLVADFEKALPAIVNPDANRLGITAIFGTRSDRRTPLDELLQSARRDVLLYGLALYNVAVENRDLLHELVTVKHCRIRVLIFDHQSPHVEAMEASLGTVGSLLAGVRRATEVFRALQDQLRAEGVGPERFEARVYRTVPTFGMIALDPSEPYGRILVEWNGLDVKGYQCPGLELRRSNSAPYLFFTKQAETVWRHGIPLVQAADLA